MSDNKSYGDPVAEPQDSYGDPVVEPKDEAQDVVGRAHEGLADAEAARRDAVDTDAAQAAWDEREAHEHDAAAPVRSEHTAPVVHDASPVAPQGSSASADLDDEDARWAAYAASAEPERDSPQAARYDETSASTARSGDDAHTTAYPATAGAAAATTSVVDDSPRAAQPIFVQAPEAPRPRGNRGAAGAIGLLAALVFAAIYLAAILGWGLLTGTVKSADLAQAALSTLATWGLWVPTVAFYFGFWFLGALINRGRWGHWVVWGLVVGVVAWAGHLLGALFAAPFWKITPGQSVDLLQDNVLAPLAIVAFVLGRELTIWFGSWVSARGRRVTEINAEAQREYERTLEAGPQLSQR